MGPSIHITGQESTEGLNIIDEVLEMTDRKAASWDHEGGQIDQQGDHK